MILSANFLLSQKQEWLNYDLDSLVSIKIPNKVFELDTIMEGAKMKQVYARVENSMFIAQKSLYEKNYTFLPYDLETLKEQYDAITKDIKKGVPYKLVLKKLIEKKNLKGCKLLFKDSLDNPTYEIEFYLLNRHLYHFYYVNPKNFNKKEKAAFFNTISINTDKKISQFFEEPISHKIGYILGRILGYILLFGIGYFIFRIIRKLSR